MYKFNLIHKIILGRKKKNNYVCIKNKKKNIFYSNEYLVAFKNAWICVEYNNIRIL